ncbi:hypothetical protein [Sphingobium phenoxybenzoativorans]|uniref:hypothetical protein n=1 Tax=Sphingobium phenoxybenzoativorans TaxID=1592790 RepID=UPI0008725E91|nr:hypothetical protein [Sphingobium phenoxybenzoativorans]
MGRFLQSGDVQDGMYFLTSATSNYALNKRPQNEEAAECILFMKTGRMTVRAFIAPSVVSVTMAKARNQQIPAATVNGMVLMKNVTWHFAWPRI